MNIYDCNIYCPFLSIVKVPEIGFPKSLDGAEYCVESESMKTKVWRKGGPVLETIAIYASPERIVRGSKPAYVYSYAQQRHMDHATRKSSCLH